jgi:hypothetical protein
VDLAATEQRCGSSGSLGCCRLRPVRGCLPVDLELMDVQAVDLEVLDLEVSDNRSPDR